MFEVGDMVWAKTHRYSVTGYHRPCKVLYVEDVNRMVVRVLDTGRYYQVIVEEFEGITEKDILCIGDVLEYEGMTLIFQSYQNNSRVLCNTLDESPIKVKIEYVRKVGGFFV